MLRIILLIVAGLLSAPLMELLSFLWFRIAPAALDLTANYFLMAVMPAALVAHFAMAVLLWKAFEPNPKSGGAIFLGCHLAAQMIMLTLLGNPLGDVASYALTLLVSGGLVLTVFDRYFWCPSCVEPV